MLENIELVKPEESQIAFQYQGELIKRIEKEDSSEDIVRLAILQIMAPGEDFGCAEKVLRYFYSDNRDFSFYAVGSYLCSFWCFDTEDIYIHKLQEKFDAYSKKEKAIVKYLTARWLEINKKDTADIITNLGKALQLENKFPACRGFFDAITGQNNLSVDKNIPEKIPAYWDCYKYLTEPKRFIDEYIIGKVVL